MSALSLPHPARIHYGWVIAAASLVIGTTAYGVYYSFTLFYPFMVQEMGWGRAEISGALTVGLIAYGVFALPMGWLLDRVGPRITIGAGGLLFGLGTFLGSQVTELWQVYALYGFLTAIGMGAAWAPLVSTISRWFVKRRGFAVGIGSIGGGTGAFVWTPLISQLIVTYGWRQAYAITGVLAGLLIVGAAMLMWRDPQSKGGGLPYGATAPADAIATPDPRQLSGATLSEALQARSFWLMIVMFGIWWFGGSIIYVQLAPFVLEKGFDVGQAALIVASFGAGNGVGKITMGVVSDRIGPRRAFALATLFAAVIMIALVPTMQPALLALLGFAFGVGFGGGSPELTTITVEMFGLRSLGVLMGTMMALMGILGAGGPLLGGLMFDLTGSYAPAYLVGAGLLLGSTGLVVFLRPPKQRVSSSE